MTEPKSKVQSPTPNPLFRFRANFTSPRLEIHQGEYRRVFSAEAQPFAATTPEEAQMLREDSHFVEVKEEKTEDGAPATDAVEDAGGTPAGPQKRSKGKAKAEGTESTDQTVDAPPAE